MLKCRQNNNLVKCRSARVCPERLKIQKCQLINFVTFGNQQLLTPLSYLKRTILICKKTSPLVLYLIQLLFRIAITAVSSFFVQTLLNWVQVGIIGSSKYLDYHGTKNCTQFIALKSLAESPNLSNMTSVAPIL